MGHFDDEFDDGNSCASGEIALSGSCPRICVLSSAAIGIAQVSYYRPSDTIGHVEFTPHTVVVPTHPLELSFSLHAPDGDAHTSIRRPFSFLPISHTATPGTSEGCLRCRVGTSPTSKRPVLIDL